MRRAHGTSRGLVFIAGAAAVLMTALSGTASAAVTWAYQTVPMPEGVLNAQLDSVSCPTSTDCIAVGQSSFTAERWNGSTWSTEPLPVPTGGREPEFLGVSCASADACAVVGSYVEGVGSGKITPVSEWWNGSTWTLKPLPGPKGTWPTAVSCASATSCLAVGFDGVQHWNGQAWRRETPAVPPGGTAGTLVGVSCPKAADCVVAGYWGDPPAPLVESWDRRTWTIQDDTLPAGLANLYLDAVSCPSVSTCFAVADQQSGPETTAMAMQSQAGVWGTPVVVQPKSPWNALNGISCVRAGALDHCTAVGWFSLDNAVGIHHVLAEYYNGRKWVFQPTAAPISSRLLSSVSCRPGGTCTAVGNQFVPATKYYNYLAERN